MAGTRDRISIHDDLLFAIDDKRVIEFVYHGGGPRLAEPHDYGVKKGVDKLLIFQIGGDSRSRAPHGWKELKVGDIEGFKVLERRFPGSRADAQQHHGVWNVLFARVK